MKVEKQPSGPRKKPSQQRSRQTLEWILEGAARVFRAEGFAATTNRIAASAGVSVGTLYEYFPNKESLLVALAARHVDKAERGIAEALGDKTSNRALLTSLQRAIVASQRYPSQAIELLPEGDRRRALQKRAAMLRERVMATLCARARACGRPKPELCARAVFGLIAELSSRSFYEVASADVHASIADHLLELAIGHLGE